MPNDLGKLLWLMADRLGQSDLPICQLVAAALNRSVGQTHAKAAPQSEIVPLKFDGINPPCGQVHMDLCRAISQTSTDLSWRRPGFGKIPDAIASHMAVCEIIGPAGQIKHETVRAGLLFQAPDITYPRHSHAAEEIYFPLTGSVDWQIDNAIWCQHEAGSFIHHLPYQPHAIRTDKIPLLTIWGWTGDIAAHSYRI
jgi:quercetin dioxygenase-like cupin family protein